MGRVTQTPDGHSFYLTVSPELISLRIFVDICHQSESCWLYLKAFRVCPHCLVPFGPIPDHCCSPTVRSHRSKPAPHIMRSRGPPCLSPSRGSAKCCHVTCGLAGVWSPPSWYLHCHPRLVSLPQPAHCPTLSASCSPRSPSLNPSLPLLLPLLLPEHGQLWACGQMRKPRRSRAAPHPGPPRRTVGEPRLPLLPRRPLCPQHSPSPLP